MVLNNLSSKIILRLRFIVELFDGKKMELTAVGTAAEIEQKVSLWDREYSRYTFRWSVELA